MILKLFGVALIASVVAGETTSYASIPGTMPARPSGSPVLWVFAHPDDETLAAGGAIHEHEEAGRRNIVVIVAGGRGSDACKKRGLNAAQCVAARRYESRVAITALGVHPHDIHHLGWDNWTISQLVPWLDRFIVEKLGLSPGQVSLKGHSPNDYYNETRGGHPVHRRVASALQTMNTRAVNAVSDVRYYRIGHLYGAFTCGVRGQGRARVLTPHWHAVKMVAASEYQQSDLAAGRYGIGGLSVPTLWEQVANPLTPECWERPDDL